ncbi:MAG: hypothetical protein NTX49_05325, partial [Chlamydiae bacterium]|nr:hypothetical protein [Chlamydiota bacterium]
RRVSTLLWLPSDSTSRWTPLPVANSSPYRAYRRLSLPSIVSCQSHQKSPLLQEEEGGFFLG